MVPIPEDHQEEETVQAESATRRVDLSQTVGASVDYSGDEVETTSNGDYRVGLYIVTLPRSRTSHCMSAIWRPNCFSQYRFRCKLYSTLWALVEAMLKRLCPRS